MRVCVFVFKKGEKMTEFKKREKKQKFRVVLPARSYDNASAVQ